MKYIIFSRICFKFPLEKHDRTQGLSLSLGQGLKTLANIWFCVALKELRIVLHFLMLKEN